MSSRVVCITIGVHLRLKMFDLAHTLDTVQPKIFEVKNFCGFHGSDEDHGSFLPQNFKFITDARCGWMLDHENFIHKTLFLSRIGQNREIFTLKKILG